MEALQQFVICAVISSSQKAFAKKAKVGRSRDSSRHGWRQGAIDVDAQDSARASQRRPDSHLCDCEID